MKEQKVIITASESEINRFLSIGWRIIYPPVAQNYTNNPNAIVPEKSAFLYVIEKNRIKMD